MDSKMLARPYYRPGDYDTISEWFRRRGLPIPDATLIPSSSIVVVGESAARPPLAFGSLYVDSTVGVGHVDWVCTRPGLTMGTAAKAIKILLEAMDEVGNSLYPGNFLLIGCVRSESMAKWAEKAGFIPAGSVEMILKGNYHDRNTTCSEPRHHSGGSGGSVFSPEASRQGAGSGSGI